MAKFLESYGATILALVLAFFSFSQFWVKVVWDKYLHKGKIDYYETGTIVIGYHTWGPVIGLNGTLRTLNKDVFIRSMDLLVVRGSDKAQHVFKWFAFQSPKIDTAGSRPDLMEIPSGFMVSPNSPHRFNITFNDNDLFQDIRSLLNSYSSAWYSVTTQLTKIWPASMRVQPPEEILSRQHSLIEDFEKSKIHVETYAALNRKCYWEPGDYQLTVNVMSSKPDRVFPMTYHFSISEEDSKKLKLNVITMLQEPVSEYLKVQNYPYNWAYSEYRTG